MGAYIAAIILLAIAFFGMAIWNIILFKTSTPKKEFSKSMSQMAALGYTYFESIEIFYFSKHSVDPKPSFLDNVYLKMPTIGEKFTNGFKTYVVDNTMYDDTRTPVRLSIWLDDVEPNEPEKL